MNIIVCAGDGRDTLLAQIVEQLIAEENLRKLKFCGSVSTSAELTEFINSSTDYVVLLDTLTCTDWRDMVADIYNQFKFVSFCLISDNPMHAAYCLNMKCNVCGYISDGTGAEFEKNVKDTVMRIFRDTAPMCGGITVCVDVGVETFVPFEDINYIETQKQTHLCDVHYKNGVSTIRAKLSTLIDAMGSSFVMVRSSMIVNVHYIQKLYEGEIELKDGTSVYIPQARMSRVRKAFKSICAV